MLWSLVKNLGLCGLLILPVLAGITVVFTRRYHRSEMSWTPLWLGFLCLILGVLGTVIGVMDAFQKSASLGGAAGPGDLARDIAGSMWNSALGLGALGTALVLTMLLHGRHRRRMELDDDQAPRPRRDPLRQ